jgi:predicted dehydrogenase
MSMNNAQRPSRRVLLPALAAPRAVLGGRGYQPPSDTLAIAGIGVGGMGRRYLQACESERIVALCDVDHEFAAKVFRRYPKATVYRDWRALLDKEKNIDAVIVGTPDHSHALITLAALERGKHVYCAKPLTHTIGEARRVAGAARAAKTATQTSVQSCASDEACRITELLMSGAIGGVREVHVWCDHPLYPAGQVRPADSAAVPAGLDWDLWIGPAPYRPYHPAYHPWIWRSWWDFGTGTVGDMLCHALHVFFEPLQLAAPAAVHGSRSKMHGGLFRMEADGHEHLPPLIQTPETESYSSIVTWDYPTRGSLPPLRLHWYDGGHKPHRPMELERSAALPAAGVLYVGEKGKLLTGYSGGTPLLLPDSRFRGFEPPPPRLPRSAGHYREWLQAAKTGGRASCDFSLGSRMTEVALLGTIAARAACYLEWDAAAGRITNDAAANGWVDPPYRAGWGK